MAQNKHDEKPQHEQEIEQHSAPVSIEIKEKDIRYENEESDESEFQEVLLMGNDRRTHVLKSKSNNIYGCVGELVVRYDYHEYKFNKKAIGTANVIFVADKNKDNEEKEANQKGFLLTCAHNIRLTVIHCTKCKTYRLKKRKNGERTSCIYCHEINGQNQKILLVKATKITFRERSIDDKNYGERLQDFDCQEYYVPDNDYMKFPLTTGGFDWAFLQFTDNGTYKQRLMHIHIKLVNGINVFNNKVKREYGIFGCINDEMVGMISKESNKFIVKHNKRTNLMYLQQTAIDTGYGQSGSLIWFKEKDLIQVCGIHCGGSQGSKNHLQPYNIATLIDDRIINKFDAIRNGWKVKFLNESSIITKANKMELKLLKNVLCEHLNEPTGVTLELLYKSNEQDQYKDAALFHSACDGKGSTLIIIQNEYKQVFGGFTSIPWTSQAKTKWKSDSCTFLYWLNGNSIKMYHNNENGRKAVAHNKCYGPCFGRSNIIIKGSDSFCCSKNTYNINGNELCGSNRLLENRFHFKYVLYEVYLVKSD
eukprot:16879_1